MWQNFNSGLIEGRDTIIIECTSAEKRIQSGVLKIGKSEMQISWVWRYQCSVLSVSVVRRDEGNSGL